MDDVAIVGGGPAGAFAALLLARAGARVRVFDRARFPRPKLCGDTLNPGACATLSRQLPLEPLLADAKPLAGMIVSGPGSIAVRGDYGPGVHGHAIARLVFDHWLLRHAAADGAHIEEATGVEGALTSSGRVTGVRVRGRTGSLRHTARVVIAADGRHSRLAFDLGLAAHPQRPRRWAIGTYFRDVTDLSDCGEMHVRRGYYIGIAPMPDGSANACLVVPHARGSAGWRDAAALLNARLTSDRVLAPRFARARMTSVPIVLGPMAVDARASGVDGLLLAGDAAGFVDPMTGDGLNIALRGAALAVDAALAVLQGRIAPGDAPCELRRRRRAELDGKLRFNRALRHLVSTPAAVVGAAAAARVVPRAFAAMIRYAGDVRPH